MSPRVIECASESPPGGNPGPADFVAFAESYGLQFGEPPWMADLVTRYGLTPPAW